MTTQARVFKTFGGVDRKIFDAVFNNNLRAVIVDDDGDETQPTIGEIMRFVSDEEDVHKRSQCYRAVTHVMQPEEYQGLHYLVSIRPLTNIEKEGIKQFL